VSPLVRPGELPGTLGDVEHDRRRGAVQLIGEMAPATGKMLDRVLRDDDEIEGRSVDIEAFVVEEHGAGLSGTGTGTGTGTGRATGLYLLRAPIGAGAPCRTG